MWLTCPSPPLYHRVQQLLPPSHKEPLMVQNHFVVSCLPTTRFLNLFLFFEDNLTINVTVLRQQQIRLGLLKAARVLFSQQENLRQIMARPVDTKESEYSLFQQLLSAATIPSPVKAMFGRDELEVIFK